MLAGYQLEKALFKISLTVQQIFFQSRTFKSNKLADSSKISYNFRNCEEEARKCMEEMDLDKDGRVSYAEFVLRWRVS